MQIVHCHLCGMQIQEKDLLAGRALTLLDRTFCHQCKEKAFSQMRSGDDQPTEATLSAPLPPERSSQTGTAPRGAAVQQRPFPKVTSTERPMRVVPVVRKKNVLPLYLGGTVGFLALTALLLILIKNAQNRQFQDKPGPGPGPESSTVKTGAQPEKTDSPADLARKELDAYVKSGASSEDIVRKCDDLADRLRSSPHQAWWMDLRKTHEEKRSLSGAEKQVRGLIERAAQMIAGDPDYARFEEISKVLKEASDLARSKVPDLLPEIQELDRKYVDPYEAEAKKWADERSDWLRTMADEKKWKDAIKMIDTFPQKYRGSKVWRQLKRSRDDYEGLLAASGRGDAAKKWSDWAREGHRDCDAKNFKKARENYDKALKALPSDWKSSFNLEEKKSVLAIWYNLACMDAVDAKKAEGDAKASLQKKALEGLEKSFREGLFQTACACHGKWQTHIEKDEDWDDLRADERFKKLVEQYTPK